MSVVCGFLHMYVSKQLHTIHKAIGDEFDSLVDEDYKRESGYVVAFS